jgi:glutathione peroxidase-family protein
LETDDYQGDEVLMERFRGKVLLIVNTASHDPEAERNFKVWSLFLWLYV